MYTLLWKGTLLKSTDYLTGYSPTTIQWFTILQSSKSSNCLKTSHNRKFPFIAVPKICLLINTQTWNMISSSLLLLNLKPVHTSCWLAWQRLASVGTFTHNQPTPLKTDWAQLATSFVQHNALDRRLFPRASPWHSQLSWKDPDMYI